MDGHWVQDIRSFHSSAWVGLDKVQLLDTLHLCRNSYLILLIRSPSLVAYRGNSTLKVLIHHRIASFDGQAVHISKLAAALRELDCEVKVVGPPVVTRVPAGKVLPAVAILRRILPQAVYEALEFSYTAISLMRLLWMWFGFRPDVVYERFNLFHPAGLWLKRLMGIPLLVEINAPLRLERCTQGGLFFQRLALWSEQIVLKGADRVLPVSRALARELEESGIPPDRIEVVPNGADVYSLTEMPSRQAAKASLGVPEQIVLGFVGFARPWNRLDWVIDLLVREGVRRNLHFLVIGEFDAGCASTLARDGRLTVTGAIAPDEVPHYLAAVDIALQPGGTDYASPIKIFEYMALARAIVAPDTVNIREILDESCAMLFTPGDPGSFAEAVIRLCDDHILREAMGKAARRRLLDCDLTWRSAAGRVKAIAETCLSRKPILPPTGPK